jgi:hypothetical protein
MAQQPVIRISLKHFKLYLLLSINISISSISVFHSRFSFHQKHWLKSHLKNNCMKILWSYPGREHSWRCQHTNSFSSINLWYSVCPELITKTRTYA